MNMAGMAGLAGACSLAGSWSAGCDGSAAAFSGVVVWAWMAIALNANNATIKSRHEMQIRFFENMPILRYCAADALDCAVSSNASPASG
jgi:hypothetical protein